MEKINVKEIMGADAKEPAKMDLSTARSRRELKGRQIDTKPSAEEVRDRAKWRQDAYISVAVDIKEAIEHNSCSITEKELEEAEFILERLEAVAMMAAETAVKSY